MKKLIMFLAFILLGSPLFANVASDKYLVEKPDGSVSILYYVPSSEKSLSQVLEDNGFSSYPVTALKADQIPTDRTDRNYWKWSKADKKIMVDVDKKKIDLDKVTAAQAKKDAVLAKLKISKSDLQDLTGGNL